MTARLCLYTQFDSKGNPLACGLRTVSGQTYIYKFHAKGGPQRTVHDLLWQRHTIKQAIECAGTQGLPIVTTDFKANLELFDLPAVPAVHYQVYDLCWGGSTYADADFADISTHIANGLKRMAAATMRDWQRLVANAAPVYHDLQERGMVIGGLLEHPRWSQQTFSGRSKALGVNVQGLDDSLTVGNPHGTDRDLFVHFDWMAADVNVAAWLSGDSTLQDTFSTSDPYTFLRDKLQLERSQCKLALLSALNRLDVTSPLVTAVFPDLGSWLVGAKAALAAGQPLRTVLGRSFSVAHARNELAVLNGMLQGSVAHAMQLTVRRVWERFRANLLMDVHDSLILTCYPTRPLVQGLIREVAALVTRPFAGLELVDGAGRSYAGDNFFFPTKVSVGSKYKQWQPLYTFREGGVHYERQAAESIEAA